MYTHTYSTTRTLTYKAAERMYNVVHVVILLFLFVGDSCLLRLCRLTNLLVCTSVTG